MGKGKKYTPLVWADKLTEQLQEICPNVNPEDLRVMISANSTTEERNAKLDKYPRLKNLLQVMQEYSEKDNVPDYISENAVKETLRDFDSISLVMMWSKNKQVFAFDKDFTNELVNTDGIQFTKNCFDFLPYTYFYIDLSDNAELCQKMCAEGLFVTTEKANEDGQEVYYIHICKVCGDYFYNDILTVVNETKKIETNEIMINDTVSIFDHRKGMSERKIDGRAYQILVLQILVYLSSAEPDVRENALTMQTYRKPAPESKPKNKYSEVRKWDVGVRFGTAYRAWKKNKDSVTVHRTGTSLRGVKQRPHSRKAHWSHYWYGSGENKICRAKWISEYYVGINDNENPAVIHKVKNENKKG